MKTIEELADEYVDAPCEKICSECNTIEASCRFYNDKLSFIAGANSMYRELTRWNSPNEKPEDINKDVLLKMFNTITREYKYFVGRLAASGPNIQIIGWREIYE